ncbi:8-oxo-dGTP diphosphatase [Arthrobacter cavernae]|uniref:Oxidized purine nucleoside triphosphate hydrolase n=1 Tax=Arthrobacter cavernae TaxID=2817681 RepID=A0A939KMR0_9MICC|nr:NUDIX domain-containing protein [Arthrobacter cavernae]MBO1268558.1 NUDIX domain-containing protein [Arthrobacter cavernae]
MTAAHVTLCFLLRDGSDGQEVLLGTKKTGFGTGKVVGVGGHLEAGETALEAACREVREEVHVTVVPQDLVFAGTVDFEFPRRPEWNMFTTVFLTGKWEGEPSESDEITPRWYGLETLPVEQMWADAEHWVPAMISGQRLAVRVILADDNESVAEVHTAACGDSATCLQPGA